MGSTPGYSQRAERNDTKTLVRLGTERGSEPGSLSKAQRELLEDIARGDAGETRVQLWFKGMSEPVRAKLRVQGGRIQLETSLAFLELESQVGVARSENSATRIEGRIARVSLVASADERVPRLCVDLALPGEVTVASGAAPALRSDTLMDGVARAARGDTTDATSTPPVSIAPGIPVHGRSWLPWTLAFALGVAGGAVGSWGWLVRWLRDPFATIAQSTQASAVLPPQAGDVQAPPASTGAEPAPEPEAAPSGDALAALLAFSEPANPLAFEAPPRPSSFTPVDSFELEREVVPAQPGSETGAEDADAQAPAEIAELAPGLEIKESAGLTEILVPMRGDAGGLERYVLTTPGIALTLPNANALVPLENYATPHRALVRRVWLRRHESGVQVRIIYPRASVTDELRFDDRGLHVLLRP